jgi:hypothetical protein
MAAAAGKNSMRELAASFELAGGASVKSAAEVQAAMAREVAATQAAATQAAAAAAKATQARQLAAAQAAVAADREAAALAKSTAASQAAAQAKVRADAIGTESMRAAAAAQEAAAARAANAAQLATQQKVAAAGRAAAAADAEAAAVAKASESEALAQQASAMAAARAAEEKAAAQAKVSAAYTKATAVVAGAAVLVGVGAVSMAAEFEKSTMRLHTSGGIAMDEVQKIRDGILEISQTVGIGASELADGMYDVVSGGYAGAEALNILKAAAQGAKAEGADMSIMATGLTSVMKAYNIPAEQAVAATNALSAASGLAKGSLQEFTGSLSSVLPTASSLGISFADVSAAIAMMTQTGMSANQATDNLRFAILALSKPTDVSSKLMAQLGIDANDLSQNLGTRGLKGTLDFLSEAVLNSSEGNRVLLGTFKESQQAAANMKEMIATMPPQLAQWSKELMEGKITAQQYTVAVNTLDINQEALGDQFLRLAKKSAGFSDAVKSGRADTLSYTSAMQQLLGGVPGLSVAMSLTADKALAYGDALNVISEASKNAGADLASNAATQSTVAAAWDRLTATVGVLAIQLGNVLLPAASEIIETFSGMIRFFQENEGAAQALGLAVGAIATSIVVTTVALKTYALYQGIAALATGGFTGAMAAANATMAANPIGIVVMAIAALVAGVIWAYNNIGWFKDGVDAAFKWISEVVGGFVSWIQTDFVPFITDAWTNITTVWNTAVTIIGDALNWLWQNIFVPVWDAIVTVAKVAYVAFMTFVVMPIQWAIGVIGDALKWMYENFWKPAWDGLMAAAGVAWKWLDDNVFKPLGVIFEWAGKVISDWWTGTVEPTWKNVQIGIGIVWDWLVKNIFEPWGQTFEFIGKVAKAAWEEVIRPAWEGMQKGIQTVWDWLSTYVFTPFGVALDVLGKGFESAQKVVEGAWKAIQDAAKAPIKFLVETVYTNGIQKTWNSIADAVGLGWRLADAPDLGFADGGVVPGFATGGVPGFHGGGAIMSGYSPNVDDRIIAVGGGEAIMRPEWTRMMGASAIHAMNAAAKANDGNGVRAALAAGATSGGFADGGIIPDVLGNIGSFFADVGTNVMNIIGGVGQFLADPLGAVTNTIGGIVNNLLGGIPGAGGGMVNAVAEIPGKIIGGLADKAVQLVQDFLASMAGGGASAGVWDGTGQLQWPAPGGVVTQFFSGLNGHNGVDIANAMGSPVIAAESGVVSAAHWSGFGGGNEVWVNHPNGLQTWYAHLNGFSVSAGQSVGRGQLIGPMGMTGNATGPHVHFMVLNGGWPNVMDPMQFLSNGGIVHGGTFDTGGVLAPGWNMVNNQTGGPEPLAPTNGLAKEIATAVREALEDARFEFDDDKLTGRVIAKITTKVQRKAGHF